jgi:hypothetical protein
LQGKGLRYRLLRPQLFHFLVVSLKWIATAVVFL